jgi:hypothetical protein
MIKSNYDATVYLNCLREDFRALKDGDWVPDAASCDASMAVLQEVMDWLDRPAEIPPSVRQMRG